MTRDIAAEKREAEDLIAHLAEDFLTEPFGSRETTQQLYDACEHWLKLDAMEHENTAS